MDLRPIMITYESVYTRYRGEANDKVWLFKLVPGYYTVQEL